MMKLRMPEYGQCIANLACSILRYYGAEAPNPTFARADELLSRDYRNVVVVLLDGMGMSTIEEHLLPDGFFRRHLHCSYSSTYPPTTVAATTAMMSGLYPNQSAWLGWVGYFAEIDRNVVYYLNKDNDTGERLGGPSAAFTYVPYADVFAPIEACGVSTSWLTSWRAPKPRHYGQMCEEIVRICAQDGRHFVYAYWEEPDKSMHQKGIHAPEICEIVREIEKQTQNMADQLEDTLLIITADHGLVDVETILFHADSELMECLVRRPSMEARALNLFVKEEAREHFEKTFNQRYGDRFQLLTREQVQAMQLLGVGENHPKLGRMLGTHLAVATSNAVLRTKNEIHPADHGGLTYDEMTIPLIAISR